MRRGCKQVSQTAAQSKTGHVANYIARIARNRIAGVAGKNWRTRIAVSCDTDTVDQPLKTGKQVASHGKLIARCPTRVNAGTGICITLDTQH